MNTHTDIDTVPNAEAEPVVVAMPSIRTLIQKAWRGMAAIFPQVWPLTLLLILFQVPATVLVSVPMSDLSGFIVAGLSFVAGWIAAGLSIVLVHYVVQSYVETEPPTIRVSVRWLFENIFTILFLMLLVFGISLSSALLLLVPFVIFSVYNLFAYIVLIREGKQPAMQLIVRSTELVRGAFWKILIRFGGSTLVLMFAVFLATFSLQIVTQLFFGSVPEVMIEFFWMICATLVQVIGSILTVSILLQLYDVRYSQTTVPASETWTKKITAIYWTAAAIGWFGLALLCAALFVLVMPSLLAW